MKVLERLEASVMSPIMLLDPKLPEVGGFEVSNGLGADGYVRKPVDFAGFYEAVEHLKRFRRNLDELPPGAAAGFE